MVFMALSRSVICCVAVVVLASFSISVSAESGPKKYTPQSNGRFSPPKIADSAKSNTRAIIRYRHLFMETKGKHKQAIKLLVKDKLSYKHIVAHANALAAMADDMLTLFPEGSISEKSRALPQIWHKDGTISQEFIEQTQVMREQAYKLVDVVNRGGYGSIKRQLRELTRNGCRGCHATFRGEEIEGEGDKKKK